MFRNVLRLNLNLIRTKCTAKQCPAKALVILANGAEESEAVIIVDLLRRTGVNVTLAGLESRKPVKTMNCIEIVPDVSLQDVCDTKFSAVVLPGGLEGVKALSDSELVGQILKTHEQCDRIIGAICAAPLVLNAHCIYKGKQLTSYPTLKDQLSENYKYRSAPNVVVDNGLVTSKGPATAFEFALKLSHLLMRNDDKNKLKEIADNMLVPYTLNESAK